MKPSLQLFLVLTLCLSARLGLACSVGEIVTAPDGEYKPIEKVSLDSYAWVSRTLKKAPELKSAQPRYCLIVLGAGKQSVVTLIFDESRGTGTGYDTLYADKNFNGDPTDEGEKFTCLGKDKAIELGAVKEAGGDASFALIFHLDPTLTFKNPDDFLPSCAATVKTPRGSFTVETVGQYTGGLHTAADLQRAPIYNLRGEVIPIVLRPNLVTQRPEAVMAGAHLGPYRAGDEISLGYQVGIPGGDLRCRFDFFWGGFPAPKGNSSPVTTLRVKDKDNRLIEELPFTGGGT